MGFENDSASDALAQLEERITRAVEIIPRLRQDKEAAELERTPLCARPSKLNRRWSG